MRTRLLGMGWWEITIHRERKIDLERFFLLLLLSDSTIVYADLRASERESVSTVCAACLCHCVCRRVSVCECIIHGTHPHTSDFFFLFKSNRWIIKNYVSYWKTSSRNFNVVYLYMRKNWQMYKLVSSIFMLSSLTNTESFHCILFTSVFLQCEVGEFYLQLADWSFLTTHCAYNARFHIDCRKLDTLAIQLNRVKSNRIKVWMIRIATCTSCHASVRFLSLHRRICNNSLHCLRMNCVYKYLHLFILLLLLHLVSVSHELFSVFVFNSTTRFRFIPDFSSSFFLYFSVFL